MPKLRLAVVALAFGLLVLPAAAQTSSTAYDAVRTALYRVWDELPLTVRNPTLTSDAAIGYGVYQPREGQSYAAGETVHVYAELLGYGVVTGKDKLLTRKLAADLSLLDAEGQLRATSRDFFQSETQSRQRTLETYLAFTARLSDFAPGEYRLRFDVRDLVSGKATQFELPITLTAAATP